LNRAYARFTWSNNHEKAISQAENAGSIPVTRSKRSLTTALAMSARVRPHEAESSNKLLDDLKGEIKGTARSYEIHCWPLGPMDFHVPSG
jgi:predicted PhzF superfamily epimerase YddE/YHI9